MSPDLAPFSSDGHAVTWATWDDQHTEELTIAWENEGWTVVGQVARERVQYVVRLNATWHVRQFLLFRDLDQPDLWLGTDGAGRWGEVNGAHRPELDGCVDIHLICTPLTDTLPIRRLPLHTGDSATIDVVRIDPDTLEAVRSRRELTRIGERRWAVADDGAAPRQFDVDQYGLVLNDPGRWRRRVGD